MFKYFKGEKENPYDNEKKNAQHQFWGYENTFENQFNKGDYSLEFWVADSAPDFNEWKAVLSKKPADKEEIFKLWLYRLLMDHLPDKYQSEGNFFLRLYYDSEE